MSTRPDLRNGEETKCICSQENSRPGPTDFPPSRADNMEKERDKIREIERARFFPSSAKERKRENFSPSRASAADANKLCQRDARTHTPLALAEERADRPDEGGGERKRRRRRHQKEGGDFKFSATANHRGDEHHHHDGQSKKTVRKRRGSRTHPHPAILATIRR